MHIDDEILKLLPETPTEEPAALELDSIKPRDLFNLIKTKGDRTLIIDIRSKYMFTVKRMIADKYINVPPDLLKNG